MLLSGWLYHLLGSFEYLFEYIYIVTYLVKKGGVVANDTPAQPKYSTHCDNNCYRKPVWRCVSRLSSGRFLCSHLTTTLSTLWQPLLFDQSRTLLLPCITQPWISMLDCFTTDDRFNHSLNLACRVTTASAFQPWEPPLSVSVYMGLHRSNVHCLPYHPCATWVTLPWSAHWIDACSVWGPRSLTFHSRGNERQKNGVQSCQPRDKAFSE